MTERAASSCETGKWAREIGAANCCKRVRLCELLDVKIELPMALFGAYISIAIYVDCPEVVAVLLKAVSTALFYKENTGYLVPIQRSDGRIMQSFHTFHFSTSSLKQGT